MRSRVAFAAILMVLIGLPACGKYGPPERTVVPQESSTRRRPPETTPPVTVPDTGEFDDSGNDEEVVP